MTKVTIRIFSSLPIMRPICLSSALTPTNRLLLSPVARRTRLPASRKTAITTQPLPPRASAQATSHTAACLSSGSAIIPASRSWSFFTGTRANPALQNVAKMSRLHARQRRTHGGLLHPQTLGHLSLRSAGMIKPVILHLARCPGMHQLIQQMPHVTVPAINASVMPGLYLQKTTLTMGINQPTAGRMNGCPVRITQITDTAHVSHWAVHRRCSKDNRMQHHPQVGQHGTPGIVSSYTAKLIHPLDGHPRKQQRISVPLVQLVKKRLLARVQPLSAFQLLGRSHITQNNPAVSHTTHVI